MTRMMQRLGLMTALAAAIAVAVLYGIDGPDGNQAAACAATPRLAEVKTHATGEVAAFVVADRPGLMPEMAFLDETGTERTIADWQGQVVLLNLWATWCVPCREEMPDLDRLQAEVGGDSFEVVAVSLDREEPAVPAAFLEEIGTENLALYTDQKSRTFRALKETGLAFGLPTTVLIDETGCAIGHLSGPAKWDADEAVSLVRSAMPVGS